VSKQIIVDSLRRALHEVMHERRVAAHDPAVARARLSLKQFQSRRMALTHADFLATPDTESAARFFLEDLYGTHDMTRRDADVERIIPTMEKMLPAAALSTIAEAVMLDALSERLDSAMADRLGESFTAEDYAAAYVEVASRADRERQLDYVQSVGLSLCELVRIPLIGATLKMMRRPARMAKLGELHDFLERGFSAFKAMKAPQRFVETTLARERRIMQQLNAGAPAPFDLG